jgi:hypothetical protein
LTKKIYGDDYLLCLFIAYSIYVLYMCTGSGVVCVVNGKVSRHAKMWRRECKLRVDLLCLVIAYVLYVCIHLNCLNDKYCA